MPARPALGYAMALAAAALFAVNGSVSKVTLGTGLEPPRLTALRCLGAALVLGAVLAATAPGRLRTTRRELPSLAALGVAGIAMTQWLYFVAIERLPVSVALLFEFTAPLMVAVAARALGRPVAARVWAALVLCLGGLSLVAGAWTGGGDLDGVGVLAALGAAVALAAYFLLGERGVAQRDPVSLTFWALLMGAAFWSVAQPWWTFDPSVLGTSTSLTGSLEGVRLPVWVLLAWVVVLGTVAPFALSVGGLRHLPATAAGIAATAEPVIAGAVAWVWIGESLDAVQLAGAAVVVVGIALAQSARSGPPGPADPGGPGGAAAGWPGRRRRVPGRRPRPAPSTTAV